MKIQKILNRGIVMLMASTALLVCACSDHEEDTTPSYADLNGFAPADNDNSPTAQLRREFFQQTGSYLLFTDTLMTKSYNGQPELLEVGYSIIGSSSSYSYKYQYITDINEQRKAADLVRTYLTPRLGKASPFSFLLVNKISYLSYGRESFVDKVFGTRSYTISLDEGNAYEDPAGYFNGMMIDIVTDALNRLSDEEMAPFYAFSSDYYNMDLIDFGWDNGLTELETWNLGFFRYVKSSYWGDYFLSKNNDKSEWINAVMTMSAQEFEAQYGASTVMMSKYNTLREIIINLGFELD